jgi:hypothetical protein
MSVPAAELDAGSARDEWVTPIWIAKLVLAMDNPPAKPGGAITYVMRELHHQFQGLAG